MSRPAWLRRANAGGLIVQLDRSPEPMKTLRQNKQRIDGLVVTALVNASYHRLRTGDHDGAVKWAELAQEASLLGGTAADQVDTALCWSSIYWHIADAVPKELDYQEMFGQGLRTDGDVKITKPCPEALSHLKSALDWGERALGICGSANLPALVPHAHYRLAEAQALAGERVLAMESQIKTVLAWAEVPGQPDPPALDLGKVAGHYWSLRRPERQPGARLLVLNADALLEAAVHWPDGPERTELLDALGSAADQVGRTQEALYFWERAATRYKAAGEQDDEFVTRRRMQHAAHAAVQLELASDYGLRCLACAPAETAPDEVANCLYNLASTYQYLGQLEEAAERYQQAAELFTDKSGLPDKTDCHLQLGKIKVKLGQPDDARREFEQVLSGPLTESQGWLASSSLADLCLSQLSDLDAAVRHADYAAQEAVGGWAMSRPALRAQSLYQSGLAHLTAGNRETAIGRFKTAIQVLPPHAEPVELKLNPYDWETVVPVSRVQLLALAYQACQAAGRHQESHDFLALHLQAAAEDQGSMPFEPTGDDVFDETMLAMASAARWQHSDPSRAASEAIRAAQLVEDEGEPDPDLLAVIYCMAGQFALKADDRASAHRSYERGLGLARDRSQTLTELLCLQGLAATFAREQDTAAVHHWLTSYVDLVERYRTSLPTAEERIRFMQGTHLEMCSALVAVCLTRGLAGQALEVVELIKSRTLADLLGMAEHKPIDYELQGKFDRLASARERWLDDYGEQFFDFANATYDKDFENSPAYQMMQRGADISTEQQASREEARLRDVLQRIDSRQQRLTLSDIKATLAS